jgi:hypothetical protein
MMTMGMLPSPPPPPLSLSAAVVMFARLCAMFGCENPAPANSHPFITKTDLAAAGSSRKSRPRPARPLAAGAGGRARPAPVAA